MNAHEHDADDNVDPRADAEAGAGPGAESDEDRAWREIVDNYGDRPTLGEPPAAPTPAVSPAAFVVPTRPQAKPPADSADPADDEGHYVPPTPPKVPRARPDRQIAWIAMFGAPVVTLVMLVLHFDAPQWIDGALFLSFVGGFGYLIATMEDRNTDGDGWDDGAVV